MKFDDLSLAMEYMDNSIGDDMGFIAPVESVVLKRKQTIIARRAWGEKKLADILGNLETDMSYHVMSGGDIDSLSFLKHVINQQKLEYCLFSTWCMGLDDVLQFEEWIKNDSIKRIDAYVGEIFPNSYGKEYSKLKEIIKNNGGRVCVFRNHAKIYAGSGDGFDFAIESSANINTNPRTENTTITLNTGLYNFYKDFYDGIKSFNRDFDDWTKYVKI